MVILSRDKSTSWDEKAYRAAVRQAIWALSLRVGSALLVLAAGMELATGIPTGMVIATFVLAVAASVVARVMIRRAHPDYFTTADQPPTESG